MTLRPCMQCGEPSSETRCPAHRLRRVQPSSAQRGYDNRWSVLSRRARRLQPWCTDCGSTEDLQADHSPEAWARKAAGLTIRLSDIDVVCGDCNRRRGAARGEAPRGPEHDRGAKAQSALHTPRGYAC